MKKLNIPIVMISLVLIAILSGCQSKKEKVTEIPVTTKSTQAQESFRQGLALSDLGENQKAREFYVKAIGLDPKLAIAYMFKASSATTPKEFAGELEMAKANLEGASEWEKLYYEYMATYLTANWNKRIEIAKKIATLYPDAARPQVDLGSTYRGNNDVANERACYSKAVELNPKWVGGYASLVGSYLFSDPKDFKKAEENALKVVELAPTSSGAEIALGDCYRAQNNLEKAKDAYAKAVELNPASSEAYYKKGHANTFLGNFDEARQNYSDGGKHDESFVTSVEFTAFTYLYAGDPKSALKVLNDRIMQIDASGQKDGQMAYAKTMFLQDCAGISVYYRDGKTLKEILPILEPLATQIGNDVGTAESKLSQKAAILQWEALLASIEGNFDAAKAKAEEIKSAMNPITDPFKLDNYEYTMGYICMMQKNFADAASHFGKTQQTLVSNKFWLASALESAGNKDKAKTLFNEIAVYNFNGLDFALIRNDVKKKLASM